jgi:hypothetical protein
MSGKGSREGAAFEPLLPAARRPFSIKSVRIGETAYPVSERELITLPWGTLTAFAHAGVLHRQVLVVAPLSGGFPFCCGISSSGCKRTRTAIKSFESLWVTFPAACGVRPGRD